MDILSRRQQEDFKILKIITAVKGNSLSIRDPSLSLKTIRKKGLIVKFKGGYLIPFSTKDSISIYTSPEAIKFNKIGKLSRFLKDGSIFALETPDNNMQGGFICLRYIGILKISKMIEEMICGS